MPGKDGQSEHLQRENARLHHRIVALEEELERRVQERTTTLEHINQTLQAEIMERQRVEIELRKFQRAVEQSPSSIVITDTAGCIEYVNPKFTNVTGYTFEEAVGQNPRILKSDKKSSHEYETLWHTILNGQEWQGEFENRKKDGEIFWETASISPITNEQGAITHFLAIKHDITERKKMEEALRESEQTFRGFVEQTTDGINLTDEHGTIIEWNRSAERMTGLPRAEVMGCYAWDVLFNLMPTERKTFDFYEQYKDNIQTFLQTGTSPWMNRPMEYELERPDGTRRYIQQVSFAVQTDRGFISCVSMHDITERHQTEQILKQAKEAAEAATRAKSEFLANMSHEIRTPMNAIIGMTTLLHTTSLTSEQREFVETIQTSSEALLAIINDILDFSKIEAGKLELNQQPFNLYDCIETSLDLVANSAAEKHLDIAYIIDEHVPPVLIGDEVRLRQVLINLLSNAVKFTDRGEVTVMVDSSLHEPEKSILPSPPPPGNNQHEHSSELENGLLYDIHIAVRDTGIGISQESLHHLFQSFRQLDSSNTRKYGGTGLGLAISKRLVELMGGTMQVESEQGKGSTFHVNILARSTPGVPAKHRPPSAPQPELLNRRVLIVDDNETNRLFLAQHIRAWGMIPCTTTAASRAVEWIHKGEQFELIILDANMLETQEGNVLSHTLHNVSQNRPIPLIEIKPVGHSRHASRHANHRSELDIAVSLAMPIKASALYDACMHIFHQAPPLKQTPPKQNPTIDPNMARTIPLRILLAEDNAVNQKVALRLLNRMGYEADVAANGREVIKALEHRAYDVILMDIQMPEKDGVETTRCIRKTYPPHQQPWIIAMTAYALEGAEEWCLSSGMDDYIGKPVRIEDLTNALRRVPRKYPGTATDTTPYDKEHHYHHVADTYPSDAAPPHHAWKSPIDPATLDEFITMLGIDVANQLIALYLEDTPRLLRNMQQAFEHGDIKQFTLSAHSIKSNSAQIGAMNLADYCNTLEKIGLNGTLKDGTIETIRQAETEYRRVSEILSTMEMEQVSETTIQ
jgi:PAS domain S-box-containing protein